MSSIDMSANSETARHMIGNRTFYDLNAGKDVFRALATDNDVSDTEKAKKTELLKAAHNFEAIFLREMMKTMRESLTGEGMFGKGSVGEIYGDMMDNAVADVASKRGSLGIADMIYRQLVREKEARTENTSQVIDNNADIIN